MEETSPADQSRSKGPQFKRAYRACINCRQRKIRCDLGSIDNPSSPPCVRCRRENKECVLATSRRGGIENVRSGREKRMRLEMQGSDGLISSEFSISPQPIKPEPNVNSTDASPGQISSRELHNTSDALNILAHAARNFPRMRKGQASVAGLMGLTSMDTPQLPEPSTEYQPETRLEDLEIVKELKLPVEIVYLLVDNYFKNLHPFYPYIPSHLHSVSRLADMPFLLAAILTLSSRYYQSEFMSENEATRFLELHDKIWDYCQKLFSKTVWAEASSRSVGTVFAFLLFSEWNPRAIHERGNDYANRSTDQEPLDSTRTDGMALSAFRRSDRMAWMLIGNAIRLAQDMDLFSTTSKVYLACHFSETVLALRLGRRSMLGEVLRDADMLNLKFTQEEMAELELLQMMSLAQETLYSSRKTTRELVKDGQYLSFLALFRPQLEGWAKKYSEFLQSAQGLSKETLLFDYHYTRLYIYSIALSAGDDARGSLGSISAARYVAAATDAARELMAGAQRVHRKDRMLRRAPIRWLVRIVHAAVFLLKSVLLMPATPFDVYQRQTVELIRTTSLTLADASPDDVHLAGRYGKILLAICSQVSASDDGQDQTSSQPPRPDLQSREDSSHAVSVSETSPPTDKNVQILDSNILGTMDMDFDFFMEGTEGLAFVEPFMEGIEQQEWFKQQTY